MAASASNTPVSLDRDRFMRQLIASLGHLNEGILGSDIAGAYIMNVGLSMGAAIEAEYKQSFGIDRPFTLDEYADTIVDLKQRIQGNFSLVSKSPEKVVVQTTSCPFDEFVKQSPSLCFMTSSVFGGIAARNFGYAKVVLHKRIALGDPGCYVTIHLQKTAEAEAAVGREYYPAVDRASPDIAEQLRLMDSVRRLRRQLVETSSRWEEVVAGAAEAIWVSNHEGQVTFANSRWRDLLGVEGDELVGGPYGNVVHPEERGDLDEVLDRVLLGARVTGVALRLQHRDGAWRHVRLSAAPLHDEAGAIVGAVGIFHDVTAEREAQRVREEFVSMASHELRTPVTTIRTLSDLLLRTLSRKGSVEPGELARRLESIRHEAEHLTSLSTDLLDAIRLQTGKVKLKKEAVDLRDVVRGSVERQVGLLGDSSEHELSVQLPGAPVQVVIDRLRVEQVIRNLLDNAVKYSPAGGTVLVVVGRTESTAFVSVTDQGIGIPEEELPSLFTPFFRASNAVSGAFAGLGLGLHLSRSIVEAHGGDLAAESEMGHGTTLTFSVPLAA